MLRRQSTYKEKSSKHKCVYSYVYMCPFYNELRNDFLPKYYQAYPSEVKLEQLFTSKNTYIINSLAKYLFFAMKKRNLFFSIAVTKHI